MKTSQRSVELLIRSITYPVGALTRHSVTQDELDNIRMNAWSIYKSNSRVSDCIDELERGAARHGCYVLFPCLIVWLAPQIFMVLYPITVAFPNAWPWLSKSLDLLPHSEPWTSYARLSWYWHVGLCVAWCVLVVACIIGVENAHTRSEARCQLWSTLERELVNTARRGSLQNAARDGSRRAYVCNTGTGGSARPSHESVLTHANIVLSILAAIATILTFIGVKSLF